MKTTLSLTLLLTASAAAAQSPGLRGVEMLAGRADAQGRVAGLEITLEPGWKTYWRIPGEAGVPPELDFSGSENLAAIAPLWPAPERFEEFGMESFGYHDNLVLPLRVTPQDPDKPVILSLTGMVGVCKEICVPAAISARIEIAPGASDAAPKIDAALAAAPRPAGEIGLTAAHCRVAGAGAERRFEAELSFARPPALTAAAAEGPAGVWIGPAALGAEGGAVTVSAELYLSNPDQWLARDALALTLIGPGGAWEVTGCGGGKG